MSAFNHPQRAVAHVDFAGLSVQFEKERACAISVRFADGQKLDDQGLSGFDFDIDFFAGLQTIEKCGRGQNGHIRVGLAKFVVFRENVGIKQRAQQIVAADGMTESFLKDFLLLFQLCSFEICTRASAERCLATQDDFLQLLRPAVRRHAQDSRKHFDNRIGEGHVVILAQLENVSRLHLLGHQKKRHVADDFAGRRDFDDVAKELVHLGVHFFGFAPAMTETHGGSLLAQVAVLTAGNFMLVQTRRAGLGAGVER